MKSTNRQAVAALVSEQVLPATGILRPCSIQGGTATQQAAVNDAHDNGYILASQALKGLQNDARYQLWFGVYLPARFNKVQAKLQAIVRGFEETDFVYIIDDNACDPGAIACTNPGDPRINICTTFFSRPPAGTNSMAGRVLHEHSHSSADTLDVRYGQAACQALAATRPDDAANNADSYEFYAGG
ncbi:M35 family metallopeptidase [Dinghuibacter silviterrae]|uniref:M35 family metallopeptidase n=1 Tax=Dinghuibacter silviterrae TaxID=1539049 RepID=UPI0013C2AA22|nr:M35 family metallopeptidase [Dinghuibacter silviterrae]